MKNIFQFVGKMFIGIAIIFLLIHSFLIVSDGSTTKDIFGFTVPEPPTWTSFIPYLGYVIDYVYQYFSIHGLFGIVVSLTLFGVGTRFLKR